MVGPVSGEFLDWSTLSAWDVTFALLSVVAGWIASRLVRRGIRALLGPLEGVPPETKRRIAYTPGALPANTAGKHVDPAPYNLLDGFSPGPVVSMHFPAGVDLAVDRIVLFGDPGQLEDRDPAFGRNLTHEVTGRDVTDVETLGQSGRHRALSGARTTRDGDDHSGELCDERFLLVDAQPAYATILGDPDRLHETFGLDLARPRHRCHQ